MQLNNARQGEWQLLATPKLPTLTRGAYAQPLTPRPQGNRSCTG